VPTLSVTRRGLPYPLRYPAGRSTSARRPYAAAPPTSSTSASTNRCSHVRICARAKASSVAQVTLDSRRSSMPAASRAWLLSRVRQHPARFCANRKVHAFPPFPHLLRLPPRAAALSAVGPRYRGGLRVSARSAGSNGERYWRFILISQRQCADLTRADPGCRNPLKSMMIQLTASTRKSGCSGPRVAEQQAGATRSESRPLSLSVGQTRWCFRRDRVAN